MNPTFMATRHEPCPLPALSRKRERGTRFRCASFTLKNPIAYRHVTHQPERPVKLPCGPGRRTRKGQAVVAMPMNWQQPRTGAFMPSGCSPRFSGGATFTASGRGGPPATPRSMQARHPRRDWGGGNITAIGPGRPSYKGTAPLWERRPRRDWAVETSQHRTGAPLLQGHGTPVGAAPSPRLGGGNITASDRGAHPVPRSHVGAAPSPRFSGGGTFTASGRGRPSYNTPPRVVCRVVAQYFSTRERSLSCLRERRPRSLPLRPTTRTLLPLNGAGGEGDNGRAPVAGACAKSIARGPFSLPTGSPA